MIEKVLLEYLNDNLDDPVYMAFPDNAPERLYVLEKTGSTFTDHVASATFALQSYGGTLYEAATMNIIGISAMLEAIELDTVTSVKLNSDYNFADTTRKRNRYQAVFNITHYEME